MQLQDICSYRNVTIESNSILPYEYISTDNMLPDKQGILISEDKNLPPNKIKQFKENDILISNIRPYFKKIWKATFDGGCSNDVLVIKADNCDPDYLYWLLSNNSFYGFVMKTSKGTKMPRGDKKAIMTFQIPDHSEKEQYLISKLLNPIQKKIQLNSQINDYLAA